MDEKVREALTKRPKTHDLASFLTGAQGQDLLNVWVTPGVIGCNPITTVRPETLLFPAMLT